MYYKEIDRLLEKKFAVKAETKSESSKTWYIPHFGVKISNKPGKVRIVFDAAAQSKNISLNNLLLSGPDTFKSLNGVIMRFRQFKYACKSDLRDMFLKIKI